MSKRTFFLTTVLWTSLLPAVTPGFFNNSFNQSKDYAESHNSPMLFISGNWNCDHCNELEAAIGTDEFKRIMEDLLAVYPDMMFCALRGTEGRDFAATANGTMTAITAAPIVCIYWPGDGGACFSATRFTGRNYQMPVRTGSLAGQLGESTKQFLANNPPYSAVSFATFPMGDTLNDRLEAIPGVTPWVEIPVVRTNQVGQATVTTLKAVCGSETFTTNWTWHAGERQRTIRYALPTAFATVRGVVLSLMDNGSSGSLAERHIWAVDGIGETTPKNPLWIGAKTADELAWGEWTMDFDVATQKVAAAQSAYTLVLIGGSLWCPDCYSTDKFLIDTAAFKKWSAVDRQVACVAIDVANPKGGATSLLTWDSARVSDRYCSCNYSGPTNETLRYESGAGYLSRHQVGAAEAKAVYERNQFLLCAPTTEGGFCRPEDAEGDGKVYGFKAGIPCLILLRADGSVAGRIYQFNNTSASSGKDLDAYICRLEELVGQDAMTSEEDNDDALTTSDTIGIGSEVSGRTLSAVDGKDVYEILAPEDTVMTFRLTGETDAAFTLTVTDDSGAVAETLATETGNLKEGVTVSAKVISDRCHLAVSFPKDGDGYAVGGHFAFTNACSTLCEYAVQASGVMSGGEIGFAVKSLEIQEGEGGEPVAEYAIGVTRTRGSRGAVSAQVSLSATDEARQSGRFGWADQEVRWADGASGVQLVYLTVTNNAVPEKDLELKLTLGGLTAEAEDTRIRAGGESMMVYVYDDDVYGTLVYRNVAYSEERTIVGWQEGDEVVVSKRGGSAPSGLSTTVREGMLTLAGAPSRAGEYSVVYGVEIVRDGVRLPVQTFTFEFTVREIDFEARFPSFTAGRTYRNVPVGDFADCMPCDGGEGDGRSYLSGLLTLTTPANGRLSAKYLTFGGGYAYEAAAWTQCEEGWTNLLTAVLRCTTDATKTMTVSFSGLTADVTFDDPAAAAGPTFRVPLPRAAWSAANSAAKWGGQYTAHLLQTNVSELVERPSVRADGYLAMRMITETAFANGAMLYAGLLPNGQPFSGTSVLLDAGAGVALLPFYQYASTSMRAYRFAGALEIAANASETHKSFRQSVVSHPETMPQWAVVEAGGEKAADISVHGGYYDKAEIYQTYLWDYGEKLEQFAFRADPEQVNSVRHGAGRTMAPVKARVTEAENAPSLVPDAPNPQQVTLAFSPETGVVSGTMSISFERDDGVVSELFPYRALVLPGWGGCEDCGDTPLERPFAAGCCTFVDRLADGSILRIGCGVRLSAD